MKMIQKHQEKNQIKIQRRNLDKEDTDSVYIATTNLINILNKVKLNDISPEEIEKSLKDLKNEAKELKTLDEEEYDIFGNLIDDNTKVRKINNKKHRELPKDKFSILDINRNTKPTGYKLILQTIIKDIITAIDKGVIPEKMPIYKAINDKKINPNEINIFNINPEIEMKEAINNSGNEINLYKLNIEEGTSGVGFTNIIFYDNQNKTLPIGMDLSTKLIIDISKLELNLVKEKTFKIISFDEEENDFQILSLEQLIYMSMNVLKIENKNNLVVMVQ